MTARGFCEVAALSRYTSGLPLMRCRRIGKSSRTRSTLNALYPCGGQATGIVCALVVIELADLRNAFRRRNLFAAGAGKAHLRDVIVDQFCDERSRAVFLHAVEAFAGEGEQEHLPRSGFVYSTRAQIEKSVLFNLTD